MQRVIVAMCGIGLACVIDGCGGETSRGAPGGSTVGATSLGAALSTVELARATSSLLIFGPHEADDLQRTEYLVSVANLAFDKQVIIQLHNPDGTSEDRSCYFERSVGNNRELWKTTRDYGTDSNTQVGTVSFSLKYVVAGNTYVDNNGGRNYTLGVNDGVLLTQPALMSDANISYGRDGDVAENVTVDLQNDGYVKHVQIVGSDDHWRTTVVLDAQYESGPNARGVGRWSFIASGPDVTFVPDEFAISYTVNGATYWDNNFGMNYFMPAHHNGSIVN